MRFAVVEDFEAYWRLRWRTQPHAAGPYMERPWLTWQAETNSGRSAWIVVEHLGQVLLAAPVFEWTGDPVPSMNLAYSPGHLIEEVAGETLSEFEHDRWLPCLLVGSRAAYDGGFLTDTSLADEDMRRACDQLLEGIEFLRSHWLAASWALEYAPQALAQSLRAASESAGLTGVTSCVQSALALSDTRWPRKPKRVREQARQYRRFLDDGGAITVERMVGLESEMARLTAAAQHKYGEPGDVRIFEDYFAGQAERLDQVSVVFVARSRGRLVGFSHGLVGRDGLAMRACGVEADGPSYTYFMAAFRAPHDYAVANRISHLNLGAGAYQTKMYQGCFPRYTHAVIRHPDNSPEAWLPILSQDAPDAVEARRTWSAAAPRLDEGIDSDSEAR